jgi:hypothetical protein
MIFNTLVPLNAISFKRSQFPPSFMGNAVIYKAGTQTLRMDSLVQLS